MKHLFRGLMWVAEHIAGPVDGVGARLFRPVSKKLLWLTGRPPETMALFGIVISSCVFFGGQVLDGDYVLAGLYLGIMTWNMTIWNRILQQTQAWLESPTDSIPANVFMNICCIMIYRTVLLLAFVAIGIPPWNSSVASMVAHVFLLVCIYTIGLTPPKRPLPMIVKDKIADLRSAPILAPAPMS